MMLGVSIFWVNDILLLVFACAGEIGFVYCYGGVVTDLEERRERRNEVVSEGQRSLYLKSFRAGKGQLSDEDDTHNRAFRFPIDRVSQLVLES